MNFKQEDNGTYSVTYFAAKELPSIVRMVKLMEQWKLDEAIAAKAAAENAEALIQEPNAEATEGRPKPNSLDNK